MHDAEIIRRFELIEEDNRSIRQELRRQDERLNRGSNDFTEIRADIRHLTEKVEALVSVARWGIGLICSAVMLAILGMVVGPHLSPTSPAPTSIVAPGHLP